MINSYRRDGATRPLFRSRVSMMAKPVQSSEDDADAVPLTRMSTYGSSSGSGISIAGRPRPRLWSTNPTSLSNKRSYSDVYSYDSSESSDSESEDEEEHLSHSIIINKNDYRHDGRPTSPTSCASFDKHRRFKKKRRTSQDSSSSNGTTNKSSRSRSRRVMFAANPVSEVRTRPRTPVDEKRKLFYSKKDIRTFRSDYYDWLDMGYEPSDLYEDDVDVEEQESEVPTTSTAVTITKIDNLHETPKACVTPDNSSEEEDATASDDEEDEDESGEQ